MYRANLKSLSEKALIYSLAFTLAACLVIIAIHALAVPAASTAPPAMGAEDHAPVPVPV